jgi:hypothetical protein
MQHGICPSASPARDGSFDNGVIIHEYHHGVANRLVPTMGGFQGSGMHEGGGDFQAITLLARPSDDPNGSYAIGQYLINDPNGFRRALIASSRESTPSPMAILG